MCFVFVVLLETVVSILLCISSTLLFTFSNVLLMSLLALVLSKLSACLAFSVLCIFEPQQQMIVSFSVCRNSSLLLIRYYWLSCFMCSLFASLYCLLYSLVASLWPW